MNFNLKQKNIEMSNKNLKIKLLLIVTILFLINVFLVSTVNAETKEFERFKSLTAVNTSLALSEKKVYVNLNMSGVFPPQDTITLKLYDVAGKKTLSNVNLEWTSYNGQYYSPYFTLPSGLEGGDKFGVSEITVKDPKGTIKYNVNDLAAKAGKTDDKTKLIFTILSTFKFNLDGISLATANTTYNVGDKIPLNIKYSPGRVNGSAAPLTDAEKAEKPDQIYITLKNTLTGVSTSLNVVTDNGSSYAILTGSKTNGVYNELVSGEYYLRRVELISSSRHINCSYGDSIGQQDNPLNFKFTIKVINKGNVVPTTPTTPTPTTPTPSTTLNSVSLSAVSAKKNEKVYVDLNSNLKLKSVMMSFSNTAKNKTMIVYLKGLGVKPYFVVPYTTEKESYNLEYMILNDTSGKTYSFSKDNTGYESGVTKFNFNSIIKIEDEDVKTDKPGEIELDNDKITSNIIDKIKKMNNNMVLIIDATSNPIIKAEVFAAIKGTNKTIIVKYNENEWLFNGNDIKQPKDIDVSVNAIQLNESDKTSLVTMLKKGLVINFQKNGELPGKALIRIKSNPVIAQYLGKEKVYVYYYDENGNKLNKVAMEITLSDDGYYEFYINHNSTYVLTNETPDVKYVSDDNSYLALNLNMKVDGNNLPDLSNDNVQLIVITVVITTTVIILIIIIIFIARRRAAKRYV